MNADRLGSVDISFGTDPERPDYACPAYLEMAPRWSIVSDMRGGTLELRAKKEKYLPKFEAETADDWAARVAMTFASDHYDSTTAEHVGLMLSEPIKLGDDVPKQIVDLMEDVDGEGNHLDVFAHSAMDAALHLGHSLILTDYPVADNVKTLTDQRAAKVRPYATLYSADEVLSWRTETVGGVNVLVQLVLRERGSEAAGAFGQKEVFRYRDFRQEVFYDDLTGRAKGLGAITWRVWKEDTEDSTKTRTKTFSNIGEGTITGPTRIPARVIYGGEKLGTLHTKPHLYGLALSNVEETQVASDYASVMHKCNVPTPVFIGRNVTEGGPPIQMGHGIDIPIGGSAIFLEPTGAAIGATRTRMQDLQARMERQGAATATGQGGKVMSATEAALHAKAKAAKLKRAARSLQDALEGMLADFAAFMRLSTSSTVKSGGSLSVNQNFAGIQLDPAYLSVLVTAYERDAISIEELRYVLQAGQLPETFDAEDVLDLLARELANREAAKLEAEKVAAEDPPESEPEPERLVA